MYKRILVPVDLGHGAVAAHILKVARWLAGDTGQVTLLHVMDKPPAYVTAQVPHEELLDRTVEVAERIAKNSPRSLELTRWVADESWGADDAESWRISDEMSEQVLGSPDAAEGTQAFLEKRAPVWKS